MAEPLHQQGPQHNNRPVIEDKYSLDSAARQARVDAAVAALRQERGVPEPTSVPQSAEHTRVAEQPAVAQPAQQAPAAMPQDLSGLLAQHEARIKAANDAEARANAMLAKAQQDAESAAAQKAKLDRALSDPEAYLEHLASTGMSEAEWVNFLSNGGKMSPEQKRIKELERKLEQTATQQQQALAAIQQQQQAFTQQQTLAQLNSILPNYPLASRTGGAQMVLNEQALLAKQGKHVNLQEAADSYEAKLLDGMQKVLQHDDVKVKLGISVSQSPQTAPVVKSPSTLNKSVSSGTAPTTGRPDPLNFDAKRKLALEKIATMLSKR